MGSIAMASSKSFAVLALCAVLLLHTCDALREKPADWDDEVDGAWEPPKEDETEMGDSGDLGTSPPTYSPPPPPEPEQYLSQEPEFWVNSFATTRLWEVISKDDMAGLDSMIEANPRVVFARAEDGRGPLFWAYEYNRPEIVKILEGAGVDATLKDKHGMTPKQMAPHQEL